MHGNGPLDSFALDTTLSGTVTALTRDNSPMPNIGITVTLIRQSDVVTVRSYNAEKAITTNAQGKLSFSFDLSKPLTPHDPYGQPWKPLTAGAYWVKAEADPLGFAPYTYWA